MGKKFTFSTIEQRNRFIARKKAEGKSSREITRLVGLSDRQIRNINKAKKQGSKLKKKKGPDRPEVLSKGQITSIRNKLRSNPYKSCKAIAAELGLERSEKAVSRYISRIGWTRKKATKVPKLEDKQISERFDWAQNHRNYAWSRVIFTDETTFSLDQCRYGWAPRGSRIPQKSKSYSPKIQVWSSISSNGPVYFTFYEDTLKSNDYVEILEGGFIEAAYNLMGNRWVFQQDGARPHTSIYTKKFLQRNVPEVLTWPPNSPDLNPIENLWSKTK